MPRLLIAKRHPATTSRGRIATYKRLKTTALVDTESCAVLNVHCSAHWPHDTQVGRRVALCKTDKIESLAGDNGYDDQSLRDALRSDGVRPVIKHRLFAHYDHAHNARLDSAATGNAGWPRAHSRPSNAYTAPLSDRASGTESFVNSCSPPQSTTSSKQSRRDPYAVRGFNRAVEIERTGTLEGHPGCPSMCE